MGVLSNLNSLFSGGRGSNSRANQRSREEEERRRRERERRRAAQRQAERQRQQQSQNRKTVQQPSSKSLPGGLGHLYEYRDGSDTPTPKRPDARQRERNAARDRQERINERAQQQQEDNSSQTWRDNILNYADKASGTVRGALRLGASAYDLLPGLDNTRKDVDKWLDKHAEPSKPTFTRAPEWKGAPYKEQGAYDPDRGSVGGTIGTIQKTTGDVATMAYPAAKADKIVGGTKFVANNGSRLVRYGANVLPGSAAAGVVDMAQEEGRGNDPDPVESLLIGGAVDLGLPFIGRAARKIPGVRQATDAAGEALNRRFRGETPSSPNRAADTPAPQRSGDVEVAPGVESPNLTRQVRQAQQAQQAAEEAAAAAPPPDAAPPPPPTQAGTPTGRPASAPGTNVVREVPEYNTNADEMAQIQRQAAEQSQEAAESVPQSVPRKPASAPAETSTTAQSRQVAADTTPTAGDVVEPTNAQGVTTRQLTPDEMRERGFPEERIEAIMARRQNPGVAKEAEPKAKPDGPDKETARAEAAARADAEGTKADDLAELRKRAEESDSKEERALLERLIRAEEQGSGTKAKAARLEKARTELAAFEAGPVKTDSLYKDEAGVTRKTSTGEALTKAEAKAEGITQPKLEKTNVAQSKATPVKSSKAADLKENAGIEPVTTEPLKKTKAQTDSEALDAARARSRAKTIADAKTAKSELPRKPATQLGDPKKAKTTAKVKSEQRKQAISDEVMGKNEVPRTAKSELPSKPKKPTQAQLNKGATENTNKDGTVSKRWIDRQRKAGATEKQINSAVEKVEGRKTPKTADEKFVDEVVQSTRQKTKSKKAGKKPGQVKAAPEIAGRGAESAGKATENSRIKNAFKAFGSDRDKASYSKSFDDAASRTASMKDSEFLNEIDNIVSSKNVDGVDKSPADHTGELGHALVRLTQMLRKSIKSGDMSLQNKVNDAFEKIQDVRTAKAAERGEGLGMEGWLTQVESPELAAHQYRNKLRKLVKAHGGDPDKAITEDEFIKHYDAKKEFSDAGDKLTEARNNSTSFRERLKPGSKDKPTRAEMEQNWKDIEDRADDFVKANEKIDDLMREVQERNLKEGNLPEDSNWASTYEAHVKAAMLSGLSGRSRDLVVTKMINQADFAIKNAIEVAFSKFLSKATGKTVGRYGAFGSSKVARRRGWKAAREKTSADWQGKTPAGFLGDPAGSGQGRSEIRINPSSLKKRNWFLRGAHTATAVPTHVTETTRMKRLRQIGLADAKKAGLKGKDAKLFADDYVYNPTKEAQVLADQEMLGISAMHKNPVSDFFERNEKKFREAADRQPAGIKRKAARASLSTSILLVMPFKKFMSGSVHYAANKNAVTQFGKALIRDVPAYKAAKKSGDTAAMAKHIDDAISHAAGGVWDITKLTAASAAILPLLSDTDAEGNKWSPPYLKVPGTDTYIPMSSFGFASAPVIHAYAISKGLEGTREENLAVGATRYSGTLLRGVLQSTGLDNVITGDNGFGRVMSSFGGRYQASDDEHEDNFKRSGSQLFQDVTTQWTPAGMRDINTFVNKAMGVEYAPETKVYNEDGTRNWWESSLRTVQSPWPGVSQSLPRSDTKKAKSFTDRFLGANTSSENYLDDVEQAENTMTASMDSFNKAGAFSDDNLKNFISDDTEKTRLFEKLSGGNTDDVSQREIDSIINDMTTTDAQESLVENGEFDSFKSSLQLKLDKMERNPNSPDSDKTAVRRDITRAELASKNNVNPQAYQLYTGFGTEKGGSISQTEFNEMMDPDSEYYDPETAEALWELDKLFTENNVSDNSKGIDPWKRPKYKLGKGGSGGGGGGGGKQNATSFGRLGSAAAPSTSSPFKYQKLRNYDSPIPNLASQTARTNLKKKISVQKGVKL